MYKLLKSVKIAQNINNCFLKVIDIIFSNGLAENYKENIEKVKNSIISNLSLIF